MLEEQKSRYCCTCREAQSQTKKILECNECERKMPKLLPGNVEAFNFFQRIGTQWRVAFGGYVGLDYNAVFKVAEIFDLEMNPNLFRKIQLMETLCLEKQPKGGGGSG